MVGEDHPASSRDAARVRRYVLEDTRLADRLHRVPSINPTGCVGSRLAGSDLKAPIQTVLLQQLSHDSPVRACGAGGW